VAGKHRKSSRRRSSVTGRGGSGLAAAAVSATSVSAVFVTGTTTAVAPSVELMALVTPANSTSQVFAGTTYYGTDYANTKYAPQQVVPFFLGPQGIVNAVDQNKTDPNGVVVLSSGWGAGQTSTALAIMEANHDPALQNVDLVILDNNTNRAGGGFWTTYYPFAPLLFTSAEPTLKNVSVPVIDTAYEYNINSSAPTYPINLAADANGLVAYLYGYGGEATAPMPQAALDAKPTDEVHYQYVVQPDGTYKAIPLDPEDGNVTYVTFVSDGLPLLRPVRLLPGGDILADTLEPAMTEIVNAGYKDNNPIPDDPTETRPMGLLPTSETTTMLSRLPNDIQTGLQNGAATAQADISSPTNFVTKPLAEAGKLPGISSLPISQLSTSTLTTDGTNKFSPLTGKAGTTSSPSGAKPLKHFGENVSSALNGLAGGAKTSKTDGAPSK
jgi:hypothetical protein